MDSGQHLVVNLLSGILLLLPTNFKVNDRNWQWDQIVEYFHKNAGINFEKYYILAMKKKGLPKFRNFILIVALTE